MVPLLVSTATDPSVVSTLLRRISVHQNVQHKAYSRRNSGSMPSECNAVMGVLVSTRRASTQAVICCVNVSWRRTTMPSKRCLAANGLCAR